MILQQIVLASTSDVLVEPRYVHTAKLDKTDMGTSIEISPKYAADLFNCNFFLGFFSKFCIIENSSDLSFPPLLMARKVKGMSQVTKII